MNRMPRLAPAAIQVGRTVFAIYLHFGLLLAKPVGSGMRPSTTEIKLVRVLRAHVSPGRARSLHCGLCRCMPDESPQIRMPASFTDTPKASLSISYVEDSPDGISKCILHSCEPH